LFGCQKQQLYKNNRLMMGTNVEVISPDKKAAKIVFGEIKRIEDLLSKYNPESEISRLNKFGKLKVSPETFYILKKSKEFWQASEGAFDITVGPLVDLWGFTDKKYSLPKESQIKNILRLIGTEKIILQDSNNVVKFKFKNMKIDLGAVAKGYAVDCAVNKLKASGIKSCLINAGGQIYCLGDKFGKTWKIAIRNPRGKGFADYLELKDKAVATAGDYEQYFIKDEKRFSHILNPKTGYPADSGVVAVTVIAPDGLTADALATAIFVLGKEKGEALAKKFADVKVKIVKEKDVSHNP
jgi:thiamine biosynthesis lipoprotein